MSILGDALLAGAVGGLKQYAVQDQQKKADEEARLAAIAKENYDKRMAVWNAELDAKPYTYTDTKDGKTGKRTVMPEFTDTGEKTFKELGFAPDQPKAPKMRTIRQGGDEVNQQFNPETSKWDEIGRGPKYKPGTGGGSSGKPEKAPKATALTASQADSLFGEVGEDGAVGIDPSKARQFAAYQARNAQRDPRYRDATFAAQQWANQVGFDPNEKLPGTIDADTPIMASTAPAAPAPPKAAAGAPPPKAAPPPAKPPAPKGEALPPDVQALIDNAESAIRRGAPAAAVKAQLKDMMAAKGYTMQ